MLGWNCSRVPAGGCERRVPAGERSDPAGSSSAQPGLVEAEGQERGRLGRERERERERERGEGRQGERGNSAYVRPTSATTSGTLRIQRKEAERKCGFGVQWHTEQSPHLSH